MSRSGTPGPGLIRGSAAKLTVPPMQHPSRSLSNLRVHSYHEGSSTSNTPMDMSHSSSPPREHLDSSASSVINMDIAEGLLLQEIDADSTDVEDLETLNKSGLISKDEQKQALRDQLKKSLSQQVFVTGRQLAFLILVVYSYTKESERLHRGLRTELPDLNFERKPFWRYFPHHHLNFTI